jgi:hypothetical protein
LDQHRGHLERQDPWAAHCMDWRLVRRGHATHRTHPRLSYLRRNSQNCYRDGR